MEAGTENTYPKISIITPSFNQGQFIEQTILSVLNQHYPNLEYIIIDGGSTDDTVSVIKKYADKLHYWVSEKDHGQADAINKGLKLCSGEIIAYINSDDVYEKNAFYEVAEIFRQLGPKPALVSGNFKSIDEHGAVIWAPEHTAAGFSEKKHTALMLLKCWKNMLPQPSTFWNRAAMDLAGHFDSTLYFAMDLDYWLKLISHSVPVYRSPVIWSAFRRHSDAKSSAHKKILRQNLALLQSRYLHSFFDKINFSVSAYAWFSSTDRLREAIELAGKGARKKSASLVLQSVLYFPFNLFLKAKLYAVYLKKLLTH